MCRVNKMVFIGVGHNIGCLDSKIVVSVVLLVIVFHFLCIVAMNSLPICLNV